jgi:hypothetical protein
LKIFIRPTTRQLIHLPRQAVFLANMHPLVGIVSAKAFIAAR